MKIRQYGGLGDGKQCTGIRDREISSKKHIKKSPERGCVNVLVQKPATRRRHMVQTTLKPDGARTRTARGEGGRHRAEGWHVRRGAQQPAQQQEHYQRGLAHAL